MNERELLLEFTRTGSETALAELVRACLPPVYSVALRQTRGDTLLAGEIAQEAFCILARKAPGFSRDVIVQAWLCRTALHLAQKAVRAEMRRRARETEAHQMNQHQGGSISWEQLAPEIDAALDSLAENDRAALILRYFENKPGREIAAAFGVSEEAARTRVSRALERLRAILARRGLPVTAAALLLLIERNGRAAVPEALAEQTARHLRRALLQRESQSGRFRESVNLFRIAVALSVFVAVPLLIRLNVEQRRHRTPAEAQAASGSATAAPAAVARAKPGFDYEAAAAALRKALRDPWPALTPPYQRIDAALANYGNFRAAAAPVLMEMLLGERAKHTRESQTLAVYGLRKLGPDAAETLDDLLILHDSGDLNFAKDDEPFLFAAIDLSGVSIPKLMEIMSKGPARLETDLILVELLKNNPGIAPEYKEGLMSNLHTAGAARDHAAIILARVPSLFEPEVLPELFRLLNYAERTAGPGTDNYDSATRKEWTLKALDALKELRPREAIEPVRDLVDLGADLEVRDAAMSALLQIDSNAAHDFSDVREWEAARSEGRQLLAAISHGAATPRQLIAGLGHRESVTLAAQALAERPDLIAGEVPALLDSIEKFDDHNAVALLKHVPQTELLNQLEHGNANGLAEIASFFDLQKNRPPKEAAAILDAALASLDQRKLQQVYPAVEMAIHQIDPDYPISWVDQGTINQVQMVLFQLARQFPERNNDLTPRAVSLDSRTLMRRDKLRELIDPILQDEQVQAAFMSNPIVTWFPRGFWK